MMSSAYDKNNTDLKSFIHVLTSSPTRKTPCLETLHEICKELMVSAYNNGEKVYHLEKKVQAMEEQIKFIQTQMSALQKAEPSEKEVEKIAKK